MQQRIKNSPKERKKKQTESIHLFVLAKYIQYGRKKNKYFIVKKKWGEEESK